jgi:hypothetical protein
LHQIHARSRYQALELLRPGQLLIYDSGAPAIAIVAALALAVELENETLRRHSPCVAPNQN